MNQPAPLSVAVRFAFIIDGLCGVVAARIAARTISAALIVLIWQRLRRINTEFQSLAAKIRAGTLPRRCAGSRQTGPRPAWPRRVRLFPPLRLPRDFGWLIRLVPNQAACFGEAFRALLAEPEMAALVAATPRAARLLRPLCRMLFIETSILMPPPRVDQTPKLARPAAEAPHIPIVAKPAPPDASVLPVASMPLEDAYGTKNLAPA